MFAPLQYTSRLQQRSTSLLDIVSITSEDLPSGFLVHVILRHSGQRNRLNQGLESVIGSIPLVSIVTSLTAWH